MKSPSKPLPNGRPRVDGTIEKGFNRENQPQALSIQVKGKTVPKAMFGEG